MSIWNPSGPRHGYSELSHSGINLIHKRLTAAVSTLCLGLEYIALFCMRKRYKALGI